MYEQIIREFEKQEKEDRDRGTIYLKETIREEFQYPEQYVALLPHKAYEPEDLLKWSVKETPVRVSAEFSIRKHTLCQIPYHHTHDFYELIYVYQGRGAQYLAGEKEPLEMKGGDVCILTPGKMHAMEQPSQQDIVLKMILPKPLMKQIKDELRAEKDLQNWAEMLDKADEVYVFRNLTDQPGSVKFLMESLMLEIYKESERQMLAVRSLLNLLFIKLARSRMEHREQGLLGSVSDYIQKNIQTAELGELAEQLGYSSRHLARRIAEETGGGFSDMLMYIRVQKAADLLAGTDLSVDDVAQEAGYQSASGLYKRFSAFYGMSPGDYRRLYRS